MKHWILPAKSLINCPYRHKPKIYYNIFNINLILKYYKNLTYKDISHFQVVSNKKKS